MDTNTVVLYDDFHKKEINDIFEADEATQRYYYYRTNVPRDELDLRNYSGLIVYTTEDDEKISYSERTKAVYFNNKLYTRINCYIDTRHKFLLKLGHYFLQGFKRYNFTNVILD